MVNAEIFPGRNPSWETKRDHFTRDSRDQLRSLCNTLAPPSNRTETGSTARWPLHAFQRFTQAAFG